jgi:hypothetical protein
MDVSCGITSGDGDAYVSTERRFMLRIRHSNFAALRVRPPLTTRAARYASQGRDDFSSARFCAQATSDD